MIESCGEIDVCLYRNDHKLRFRAIVAQNLHCPVIGGTTFIKDNNIKQDFVHNQISLLGNKCTILSTQREALLPIAQHNSTNHNTIHTHKYTHQLHSSRPLPHLDEVDRGATNTTHTQLHNTTTQPLAKPTNPLVSIKSKRIILPGDYLTVKADLPDQDMVVEAVKTHQWPPPTLAAVKNNLIKVTNTSDSPVLLDGKHTLSLQLTPTMNSSISDPPPPASSITATIPHSHTSLLQIRKPFS